MTTRLVMPVDSSAVSITDSAFDDVLVVDGAVDLGQDRARVGVPLGQPLAALDRVALVDEEPRAVGDAVRRRAPSPSPRR